MLRVFPVKDTSIEVALQLELTKRDIPFVKHKAVVPHHQCDIFIEPNIVVEADGDYWHNLPVQKEKDARVNAAMNAAGYLVLRYWEHEIRANAEGCVDEIEEICASGGS